MRAPDEENNEAHSPSNSPSVNLTGRFNMLNMLNQSLKVTQQFEQQNQPLFHLLVDTFCSLNISISTALLGS